MEHAMRLHRLQPVLLTTAKSPPGRSGATDASARPQFYDNRYDHAGVSIMSLKGKAAAIGIGELKPVKEPGDATALGMMCTVAAEAISDAGLEKKDIDGFLVGVPFSDPGMIYPGVAAEVMGINPRMLNQVDIGGATAAGMIWRAAAAIDAGMCEAVLCLVADLNRVGDQRPPVISV